MKRSTKRLLRQGVLYAVLVAVVVYVGVSVKWHDVRAEFWAPGLNSNWHDLITIGLKNTFVYTVISFAGGLVLALILALMRVSDVIGYRWLATLYVDIFRGLPAIVTMFVMAFGVPIAFQWTPPGGTTGPGIVGLIIVYAAYMAETIRAGLQAVPKGQTEAARSLGMSNTRTMALVVIPQAFRIIIPPLTNEFVALVKDTSLLLFLGATTTSRELATVMQDGMNSGQTAATATTLVQAGLLYLVLTIPLTQLVSWLERRQQRAR